MLRESRRFSGVLLIITSLLLLPTCTAVPHNTATNDDIQLRPYIERIVYRQTDDLEDDILNNEIDLVLSDDEFLIYAMMHPDELMVLDQDPNIDLCQTTNNGYFCIDFSC